MADKKEKFLSVEDIEVVYTSNGDIVHAVNGVSFDLNKGETLGLVGETGAGKTTIAKTILRILPDPPAKMLGGKVYLDGEDLWAKTEEEMLKVRGDKIAMIFQDPMTALNPLMTVGEQIVEVLLLHNDYGKATAVEKAKEMLELVGIPGERFVEYPHQFSGGMKQRVVIAMALACDPELVLADEPTTALDVTIQAQVLDLIRNLQKRYNTAMILITHDLGVVAQTCDKVAVIYAGEIIEYGNLEALFDHPTHPYTLGLFGSLPDITREEERLHPIDGMPPDPTNLPEGCSFHPRCPYATEQCCTGSIPLTELAPGHLCRCCMRTKEENR
jgi:peptide/nickel transport system ATP-binding protein